MVSNPDGSPSLVRLSGIVEQLASLMAAGKRVVLVTSGAVGCGRMRLRKQGSFRSGAHYDSASASAGQLTLMSLYATLFSSCEREASQFLVTQDDFEKTRRHNLKYALSEILSVGMIPIINENDAVSANRGYGVADTGFSDNDGLAALVAGLVDAQLLVLLSDVRGLYDRPPGPGAQLLHWVTPRTKYALGEKSTCGRGGMDAKLRSAFRALDLGVQCVALASGHEPNVILKILAGDKVGTIFSNEDRDEPDVASCARAAARHLQSLDASERTTMLENIATALEERKSEILEANAKDMAADCAPPLKQRLSLQKKLDAVIVGARALAASPDPVHRVLEKRELSPGLVLEKKSCALGVVLVIFEARPEALVQIACLATRAGCALILKGGSEARHSNTILASILQTVLPRGALSLLHTRAEVSALLENPDSTKLIDLVVPRGSNTLVRTIQASTKIPVLGHADGVCHVFVDQTASLEKAAELVLDSKCDYPAACNAAETLLIHKDFPHARELLARLNEISLKAGDHAIRLGLLPEEARTADLSVEYGDKTMLVEVVDSATAAVDFINAHSSNHTDCIVTEDEHVASLFLRDVDSACVFHNASTRFADGFRFGLGAELGVATGRLHARGPVGVQGFLTYKWCLRSDDVHTQHQFASSQKKYTHKELG